MWYIPLHFILNPGENTSRRLFSWGQFCSCTRTKHVRRRWKPSPSYRSCHHISKKATLLSAFLTWSQFPSILALLSEPDPCQQLGVDEAKKKKTSQVKFKDVFLLEARPCCYKPRETFSCSTFLWFLSEFPPFLPRSTLAPQLPTAALAVDHDQQGIIGGGGAVTPSWSRDRSSAPPLKALLVYLGWLWLWWTRCLDTMTSGSLTTLHE